MFDHEHILLLTKSEKEGRLVRYKRAKNKAVYQLYHVW